MSNEQIIKQLLEEIFELKVENAALKKRIQLSGGTPEQIQKSIEKNKVRAAKKIKIKERKQKKKEQKVTGDRYIWEERYKHPMWRKRRQQIIKRDGFKCAECGCSSPLHVHHLTYQSGFKVWEYEDKYLITLCEKCHEKKHDGIDIHSFINKGTSIEKFIMV